MTWIQHHRESEDHASEAEACLRLGNREKARDLYALSARAEELALKKLHHSKVRTYGITAVSAASLYFKAGQLDCAERIATEGMAFDGLPAFARHQLRHIMQVVRAEQLDFRALRDESIPLPQRKHGYRHAMLLGTTGAGKTTLVRQLIGTDPSEERFPSTSTSKTTIHDTEIILDDGPWRAVVTFVPSDKVRDYLNECIFAAVRMIVRGEDDPADATVLRCLLNHANQRFRFSYVLGNGPKTDKGFSDFAEEDEDIEGDVEPSPTEDIDAVDLAATNELLGQSVKRLRDLARELRDRLHGELGSSDVELGDKEEDKLAFEELFEEELDDLLRNDETPHEIAGALMDEIEKRFDLLPPGTVTKTRQGWPLTWKGDWPVDERSEFLKSVSRFSSNYAPLYGRLLTPLVNGVRVAGQFSPTWEGGQTRKLVLFDGEGLGHTPESSSSVSTDVSRLINAVDAVLLVDNATQPMLAAPFAAMRELAQAGNGRKLILAFTHFDEVKGDNLPNSSARAQHVLASAENVLAALGKDLGPYAERILRERLDTARFFLGGLQKPLSENTGRRTVRQLRELLVAIDQVIERPQHMKACPVYDRSDLTRAIRSAAGAFHEAWRPRLGLESRPGFAKEHWTRVQAMNRRLAAMREDEYDTLRPVADLRQELLARIYVFIQSPLCWEGREPREDERRSKYDALADSLGKRLLKLSTQRVWRERIDVWERAYRESGKGSTSVRARIIGNDIYEPAAPVLDGTPDRNQFLREVVAEVEAAAEESGAKLRGDDLT